MTQNYPLLIALFCILTCCSPKKAEKAARADNKVEPAKSRFIGKITILETWQVPGYKGKNYSQLVNPFIGTGMGILTPELLPPLAWYNSVPTPALQAGTVAQAIITATAFCMVFRTLI